ncbi:putative mediator of RNA polymerase II transcription subunit 26 [Drosophila sulfurigaster albostrigata]|uniref:putative mediator of RNA polymerase II transcription subunit 26 n=1 Tax=Drosophila sulfurigaster albostrigata TaxID=89887 RepID=UPI002D2188CB|nr:putative mediator of RNA polymerase II transcription subunit 26 [Drosophila sulfurigaster albostrigata]XP_062137824.1 putative mediator of RNA polymerase II transcription subunit 26 [Drosophila sulfurigaster albostrigata]
MSDTGDDVIEVNGDSPYSRAKLQQLRACAPFVRTLVTTFKHKMAEEQWTKLNMLMELLESENMSSAMFARCTESKLTNIETMINKVKSKYEPLLHPTEVIVIDGDQPSTSTAARRNASRANKGKSQEASTSATATSSAAAKTKSPATLRRSKTVAPAAKASETKTKPFVPAAKLPTPKTANPTNLEPERCANLPAPTASNPKTTTAKNAAEKAQLKEMSTAVKETIPLNFCSIASQKRRANPPAPSPELTTVQDDLLERRSTAATIVDREPVAAKISAPKPDFERRSNPPKPTKPTSGVNLGLEPSLAARLSDIDSSIGSRRVDYVRRSPRNTQTPMHPTSLTDATLPKSSVFVRRPAVVPVPIADAETQRRSNPPAPAALEEARKKLAALAATPETTPASPSDCTDPRGRSGSYAIQIPPKASVSPIQSSAKGPTSWPRKENIPVKEFPLPQSIPVIGSPSGSSAKPTTHTSPPTTKSIPVIGSPANINNNSKHNVNLNMPNALHGSINLNRAPNLNNLSTGNVDGFANGFNNGQEASSTRRYGNLGAINGAGSRDPRRAKWGQSNGPQQQQQPQQHPTGSQYSPQGGQRRGGPSGWQASNNPGNYNSYNPGGNPNGGNTNNNNPGWINNNNNNGHFINGSPNFNYNNRPMFNRATSLGGGVSNAPQGPGNNNINGPPYSGAPRTYREHLAAKAKQQEMQRQLEANEKQRQHEAAEKQRQLEAAEKQRQLEADEKQRQLEAAEKQRQLDAAAAAEKKRKLQEAEKQLDDGQAVAAPSRMESDNVQLDTSYRNVVLTGTTNKKLDFKIPKKASLEKSFANK